MATEAEEKVAKHAQDGARAHYARAAKGAIAAGLNGSYTVQPGDTYESIADAVYGHEKYGADIFDASLSSGAVSSNRKTELPGGTVLVLPVVAAMGQPSSEAAADAASDVAARRPVGERASTTGQPTGRVGGVGDADEGRPVESSSAPKRSHARKSTSTRRTSRASSRSTPARRTARTPSRARPAADTVAPDVPAPAPGETP